jgi:hypothetical protein
MNIPPINSTVAYQGLSVPMAQKNAEEPNNPTASPFRAWTRAAGKTLAATSAADLTSAHQSSNAFWAQWPEKKWVAAS